ncbi:hypothetical protein [Wolbachia endosymbiont (group A) of Bibio marci]|uniref:hypothetical protein n=1 Tax=Wolbachia endosymbiont (group A) of Bibio marci TaxID=2953987 RepID=UPI002232A800|nr:hypothetical protein [Wolbachia endosymbiont (group A) of Bibio marci]
MTKKGNGSSSLYIFILLLCHTYKDLISTYKNGSFIRKIDPEVLKEYVKKHPASRNETKSRIWNKFNLV